MTVTIGSHVDALDPIEGAQQRGAQVVQISLSDPQSWKKPAVEFPGGAGALRDAIQHSGLTLVVHAPYVINVASTNNRIRIPGRKLLQQTVDAAAQLGAIGVVVHGGHVTKDDDPEQGFDNWRKAVEGLDAAVPIFIENTAGGQHAMARQLESIARLWEAISHAEGFEKVGFCLDTCHAHAAGLGLSGLVDRIRAITGRIDLVHANDSRDAEGSGADRHANLGKGQVDPAGLVEVVATAGAPAVVETPGESSDQAADILWLRERL
ncbi:deoxyribonuclease-4 [Propionibacterium cyclohexanicum]|uniref:Deoxyribonuclease-4 n=1 Tax=Propionibacterium cyclohexanicum TaxID=64702 RepID=A0A1H9RN49_9ACTN|nr:deoxyribonuclease IV [Propionibacterium cyclohexanicum]SER74156.1 deoxyribonuclease-4 [Propionibacterium cyclohexanicum]